MASDIVVPSVPGEESPRYGARPGNSVVRNLLLWGVPAVALLVAGILYGRGGTSASTDNAYVKQDRVDVAALVSADVSAVRFAENARVEAGDAVLELEDSKLRSAESRAVADLENARLAVATLRAEYRAKKAAIALARERARYADREYARQRELLSRKLIAEAALDQAHEAADAADGQVELLGLQLDEVRTRLAGDANLPIDQHPTVRAAAAELERVRVDLRHAIVRAPQSGIVSQLPRVGDHVEAGRPAFALVLSDQVYVEANLKETDLGWVKPGQRARVRVDLYPGVDWHGRVQSVAQATGAEFSLLPTQNASGNWVKVVQRVPVRIVLERDPTQPLLRSGASAEVEIETDAPRRLERWLARLSG